MKVMLEKLESIVAAEITVYRALLELARRKGAAVIAKRMLEVHEVQEAEGKLIEQISQLEPQRQFAVRKLCRDCGLDAAQGHVSMLVAQLGAVAEPLQQQANELRALLDDLKAVNAANAQHIRENIECLQGAIDAIRLNCAAQENYDASGDRRSRALMIDGKV